MLYVSAYSVSSSSACSSGGPSSPTAVSSPDDIMRRLKQLIDRRSESTTSESPSQDRGNESEAANQVESPRTASSDPV